MSDLSDWENALSDEEEKQSQQQELIKKQEQEEKLKLQKERAKKDQEAFDKLDAKAKKLKLREIEIKNDAQNTLDLFVVSPTKEADFVPTLTPQAKIDVLTSQDIGTAVETISNLLNVKEKVEVEFYQVLMKELLQDMNYFDIREITSALDTMANEKQRSEKGNKKKKKKAQVTVQRGLDMNEFEDFM